jgi:hypothetical protein
MSDWFIYTSPDLGEWVLEWSKETFREPEGGQITIETRTDVPPSRVYITRGPLYPMIPADVFGEPTDN